MLRAFAEARGWVITEYTDHGVSGARTSRPALDALLAAARARRIDVVLTTKLDRLARSTRHLVGLAAELEALGVELVVTDQAIDTTTPAGRLMFHVLSAIAEFERDLIRERVVAGIRRARSQGRHVGRPAKYQVDPARAQELLAVGDLAARSGPPARGSPQRRPARSPARRSLTGFAPPAASLHQARLVPSDRDKDTRLRSVPARPSGCAPRAGCALPRAA